MYKKIQGITHFKHVEIDNSTSTYIDMYYKYGMFSDTNLKIIGNIFTVLVCKLLLIIVLY